MADAGAAAGPNEVPLIGRHATVEALLTAVQNARTGRGRILLLEGEGGVGKSTFLKGAAEMGRSREFRVLEGRSTPSDLPVPFELVRSLLRSARGESERRDRAEAAAPPPTLPMFLAPYEADATGTAARATGLADAPPDTREADRLLSHLAEPSERVDANRTTLFVQLADFFTALADEGPVLLLLDDLHLADDSSLEFLTEFLPALSVHRLLILASTLPVGEAPERTRTALASIAAGPDAETLSLGRMSEPDLAEYVRWLQRGRAPDPDLVMRWYSQTDGNPLFTEYLVRASSGTARPAARPAGEGGQGFEEILRARVRELPPSEQRLLVYGSILGREFDFPTVAATAGQEERLTEALDHLVNAGILRERTGEVYEFVSERLRADVYAQLTETRRRLLHRRVARVLEGRGAGGTRDVYELARQFYLGRDDENAVDYNRRAADLAAKAFAFDSAVVHLERALESQRRLTPRDLPLEVLILIELGRYLDELGDLHRSEAVLLDGVARARTDPGHPTELALALLGLAQTRADLTQYVSARDLALEAFGILERIAHDRGLLAAHRVLGVSSWRMGELAEAESHQRAELALAEKIGTPTELGHALIDLANTFTLQTSDRAHEAMALYERAAGVFQRGEDHTAQARVLMNHALLLHYASRPDDALAKMREALLAAERSRSKVWIGYCCLNLAQFLTERDDLPGARDLVGRAETHLGALGDRLAHQQLTMIRGMIHARAGEFDVAEERFVEAARLAKELDLTAEAAEMEVRFAELEWRRGRPERARERIARARAAGIERLRADLLPRLAELERGLAEAPSGGRR